NSTESSAALTTSTFSIVVPRPTAQSEGPLVSLLGKITVEELRMETYRNTPELSSSSLPPKRSTCCPFTTVSGNPSKVSYLGLAASPATSLDVLSTLLP